MIRRSYIYFTLKMTEDGIQDVTIRDNKFINVSYITPGLIRVQKLSTSNMKVDF